jgi:G3E family GTPase
MGFLGVGLTEHFLPPIQVSVIDAKHWQKRGYHNELEAHQIQVSSLVILNHTERVTDERISQVKHDVLHLNPTANVRVWDELKPDDLLCLNPSMNTPDKMDHIKAHWSSCSVDLPDPITSTRLHYILNSIPDRILRIKGCTKLDDHEYYSLFERLPSGEINIKRYYGDLVTGPKLLTIGPGSDPDYLNDLIETSLSQ